MFKSYYLAYCMNKIQYIIYLYFNKLNNWGIKYMKEKSHDKDVADEGIKGLGDAAMALQGFGGREAGTL